MQINCISFYGKPNNYAVIDKYLSRSAQPTKEDLLWLKENGVTDIFNFRTMYKPGIDYDEKIEVEKLGMKYHNIPTIPKKPAEDKVFQFLSEINSVISSNGKAHLHCQAGADRTGMYTCIYKTLNGLGSKYSNFIEMIKMKHSPFLYPKLIPWTNRLIEKLQKNMKHQI